MPNYYKNATAATTTPAPHHNANHNTQRSLPTPALTPINGELGASTSSDDEGAFGSQNEEEFWHAVSVTPVAKQSRARTHRRTRATSTAAGAAAGGGRGGGGGDKKRSNTVARLAAVWAPRIFNVLWPFVAFALCAAFVRWRRRLRRQ